MSAVLINLDNNTLRTVSYQLQVLLILMQTETYYLSILIDRTVLICLPVVQVWVLCHLFPTLLSHITTVWRLTVRPPVLICIQIEFGLYPLTQASIRWKQFNRYLNLRNERGQRGNGSNGTSVLFCLVFFMVINTRPGINIDCICLFRAMKK